MIYVDALIVLTFIFAIAHSYIQFQVSTKRTEENVKKASLNRPCREYLSVIKGYSQTAPYGMLTSVIVGLLMFIILKCMQEPLSLANNIIYLITLITFIITFGVSYKVMNCFVARSICPADCGLLDYPP